MALSLQQLTQAMAVGFQMADSRSPQHVSRTGRAYRPGIGPHSENAAVALVLAELADLLPEAVCGQFLPYPNAPRQKCDVWCGRPLEWAVEVKMARFRGDNGKPDDTAVKDLLSPYASDRSALTDCEKLAGSGLECRTALMVYGFDYEDRPLDPAIDALELLAAARVTLGARVEAVIGDLVHPVHAYGRLFAWEIHPH
jgi:hypothetical protein